ncbi:hypothetical protein CAFE_35810 [Caprobacter fermentans]|uniref:Nudix hydrolase domain-containing protein n=1 Tax=Caproicibacter fermentans TaxID=2576756 RepID=A0A6N8I4F7_9FIRM|nr:hypothetical protein [Caproicibacter fermentans]MVB12835.1 hypothetical protein [Caproicibacter fermentans]OCN02327.1 hypothetical protein A7X67_14435 [Clostridium sp. W14A]
MPELCDVCDQNKNRTGRVWTRGVSMRPGDYRLVVYVGELRLQPEEVTQAKWVGREEYEDMCRQGIVVPACTRFYEWMKEMEEKNEA